MSRLMKWAGAVCAAVLLACGAAGAKEMFVAVDGNDGAAGTKAAPWKSIDRALKTASPGDTITLLEGTHTGQCWFNKPRLTLQGEPGKKVTLKTGAKVCVWFMDGEGCTVRNLELTGGGYHVIKFEPKGSKGTVEDCKIHKCGEDCIKITPGANDITIRRCEIYDTSLEGIDNVNGDRMVVQDCYIHHCSKNGIYAKGGAEGCIIERCLVTDIGEAGIMLGQTTGDAYFDKENTEFYENIDGIVRNCIVMNTHQAGLAAWAALRPKFYNNTLINCNKSGSQGGLFTVKQSHQGKKGMSKDLEFVNNLVVGSDKYPGHALVHFNGGSIDPEGKLVFENNWYFGGGDRMFIDARAGGWKVAKSLEQWQQATGLDKTSFSGDPKLDNNQHLTKDSPCIGKGKKIEGLTDDYDGQRRGDVIDVGADQYGAEALAVPPAEGTVGTGRVPQKQ